MSVLKIEPFHKDRYTLYTLRKPLEKMKAYVDLCDKEIGWYGSVVELDNDMGFLLTDVYLFKQEVNSATCEIDEDDVLAFFNGLTKEQQDEFMKTNRLWGHSHVNMGAFASGQDDDQGTEHAKNIADFYIRLITNKKEEYYITFYDKKYNIKVTVNEIKLLDQEVIALREEIKKEIDEKVSEKKVSIITNPTKYSPAEYKGYDYDYGSYYSGDNYYKRYPYDKDDKEEKKGLAEKLPTPAKVTVEDVFNLSNYYLDLFN